MNTPDHDDDRLRALFHDAVSDVQPRDRLADVRRRTRVRRTSSRRRWTPVLLGAGAVAATVVAAAVVVNGLSDDPAPDREPPAVSAPTIDAPTTAAAAIYFTGPTPTGERLFREYQVVGWTSDPAHKALLALQRLTEEFGPRDPDYLTVWPDDSFEGVRIEDDRIVVELGESAIATDRSMFARLAPQQVVYTAEAAIEATLPVAFEYEGAPARSVLGQRVRALVERDRHFEVTAPVNITNPAEGLAIEGGTFVADGTVAANITSPVRWTVRRGGVVLLEGRADASDDSAANAPAWETATIDVSALPTGDYVFEVRVRGAGQTSDRPALFTDTRTITVR